MNQFLVYGLVDPRTGEVRYIGRSSSGLRRPRMHFFPSKLTERNHKANWMRSLLSAGVRPEIIVLEEFAFAADTVVAECFWIAQARGLGWSLTNQTDGGEGASGAIRSPETRARISRAVREHLATSGVREQLSTAQRARFARAPVSTETRAKISANGRGRTLSADHRAKISTASQNRSPEYRAKISAANRARVVSPETRAKLSATSTGRKATEETRAKMRLSQKGRKHSAATRLKMSLSALQRWAGDR